MVYLKPLILGLKSRSALRLITFHLPKKWVKCTEKTQISGIIFKRHEIFWPNLYTLFSFMHALPKTHGVYMYRCSRFIASTAEAYAIELNMGRRPSLSTNERSQAVGMLRAGQSSQQVAAVFGVAQSTISRLLQHFNATQSANDRRLSCRPRTPTRQQDNYICNITHRNLRITARAL